jgi:hypothetical protein
VSETVKIIMLPGGYALRPNYTGQDVICASLNYWRNYDDFLMALGDALSELNFSNHGDQALNDRLYGAIEHYLAKWRMDALHDHWRRVHGTTEVSVNVASAYVMLPSSMHLLNTFMGLRKVPRVFAHLYTHAFVLSRIEEIECDQGIRTEHEIYGLWRDHERMVEILSKGVETTPDAQ